MPAANFFISYTQADKAWAEWLAWQLEAAGYSVVIQAWDFAPGSNFVLEMNKATADAERTIAVLSPDYLRSSFTPSEWAAAFAADPKGEYQRLLPFRVREVDPRGLLAQISWTDLVDADEAAARERVLAAVRGTRAKPSREPAFPGGALDRTRPAFPVSGPRIKNLPGRNSHFTGRAEWIVRLEQDLVAGERSVVTQAISGLGGIGKTQLALEYAHRNAAKYEIVWWIRAETDESRQADLHQLAKRVLADPEPAVESLLGWLEEHSGWLLVFDNVEKPDDIEHILPRQGGGHIIITSRHGSWGKIATPLSLNVWTEAEATAYVVTRTGQGDEEAQKLVAELGFLPLAVEQAVAYIDEKSITLAKYTELFKSSRSRILKASTSKVTVATVWEISLAALRERSSAAISLLNLLAFLPPDSFPRQRLLETKGVPARLAPALDDEVALNEAIAILRQYSLVTATPEHVSVHRLVQAVVQDRLSDSESRMFWTAAHHLQHGGGEFLDDTDVRPADDIRDGSELAVGKSNEPRPRSQSLARAELKIGALTIAAMVTVAALIWMMTKEPAMPATETNTRQPVTSEICNLRVQTESRVRVPSEKRNDTTMNLLFHATYREGCLNPGLVFKQYVSTDGRAASMVPAGKDDEALIEAVIVPPLVQKTAPGRANMRYMLTFDENKTPKTRFVVAFDKTDPSESLVIFEQGPQNLP